MNTQEEKTVQQETNDKQAKPGIAVQTDVKAGQFLWHREESPWDDPDK
jgi:hypothetical protein